MGIIFHRTLKCEHCGYEYHGKGGGHVISNGEHYDISQYYCSNCHSIIDLECYSSLRENTERYTYPDGAEVTYDITKKDEEFNPENTAYKLTDSLKNVPPLCKECGNHLFRLDIDNNGYACCPKCGRKSFKQKNVHVAAYID